MYSIDLTWCWYYSWDVIYDVNERNVLVFRVEVKYSHVDVVEAKSASNRLAFSAKFIFKWNLLDVDDVVVA